MNLFSALCILLLSSNASLGFGSSTSGPGLEKEHGKKKPKRNLSSLQSEQAILDNEAIDESINDLFEELEDETYAILAESYTQLSQEINNAILEVNSGLDEEDLAYAREAFMDFLELEEDNDAPYDNSETSLITKILDEDEEEGTIFGESDNGSSSGVDAIKQANDQPDSYRGNTRGYNGRTSYRKKRNKGCRNYHGEKGSKKYDYDLHTHTSKSWCESKCNSLGQHCYGYEYYSYDRNCEIWRVPIYYVEYVHGLDCFIKK